MRVNEDLERGRELLARGDSFGALQRFQRAYQSAPGDPAAKSYYGLLHALERGQVQEAISLCAAAVDGAPERADLHLNLGRVYLKAGDKAKAIAAFRAGLERDPGHAGLAAELRALGIRRQPIFPSLGRSHPLNRILGKLVYRLGRRGRAT